MHRKVRKFSFRDILHQTIKWLILLIFMFNFSFSVMHSICLVFCLAWDEKSRKRDIGMVFPLAAASTIDLHIGFIMLMLVVGLLYLACSCISMGSTRIHTQFMAPTPQSCMNDHVKFFASSLYSLNQ